MFAAVSAAYRRDPQAVDGATGRDEVLGFGADAVIALAPVALSVASTVVEFVSQPRLNPFALPSEASFAWMVVKDWVNQEALLSLVTVPVALGLRGLSGPDRGLARSMRRLAPTAGGGFPPGP